MVVMALAGRRVDAAGAPARLPPGRTLAVRAQIRRLLMASDARALVCSAACGADILALEASESLGLQARIVLPFSVDVFRSKSVADRPGDWGLRYEHQVRRAASSGHLRVLPAAESDDRAFADTNQTVLDEAQRLAGDGRVIAVIVWEGSPRGPGDLTAAFGELARRRAVPLQQILSV